MRVDIKGTPPPARCVVLQLQTSRANACQRVKGTDRQLKSDTLIYNTGLCGATERSQASYDFIRRSLIRQHGRDHGGGRRD